MLRLAGSLGMKVNEMLSLSQYAVLWPLELLGDVKVKSQTRWCEMVRRGVVHSHTTGWLVHQQQPTYQPTMTRAANQRRWLSLGRHFEQLTLVWTARISRFRVNASYHQ